VLLRGYPDAPQGSTSKRHGRRDVGRTLRAQRTSWRADTGPENGNRRLNCHNRLRRLNRPSRRRLGDRRVCRRRSRHQKRPPPSAIDSAAAAPPGAAAGAVAAVAAVPAVATAEAAAGPNTTGCASYGGDEPCRRSISQ